MQRIKLTSSEKAVLRHLFKGGGSVPAGMSYLDYCLACRGLQAQQLANVAFVEGGGVECATISDSGKIYFLANPHLYNPVNWNLITIAVSLLAIICSVLAAVIK